MEGAGVIEAVGEGVTHLKPGDRAAYAGNPPGSYSQVRVMPALTVCRLPDDIGFDTAAAMMLWGLTAQYLLRHAPGRPKACSRATTSSGTPPRRRRPDRLASGPRPWAIASSPPPVPAENARWRLPMVRRQLSITERKISPARCGITDGQGRQGGVRLGR